MASHFNHHYDIYYPISDQLLFDVLLEYFVNTRPNMIMVYVSIVSFGRRSDRQIS
jgi:hypothetical protein